MAIKKLKAPYDDYGVDSSGVVWSFKHGTKTKVKSRADKSGHLRVNLADKGSSKNGFREFYIHRLVARAFLGKGDGMVLHKDGDKNNNAASNLEYGSAKKNAQQREAHKRGDEADIIGDEVEFEDSAAPVWRFDNAVEARWEVTPEGYLRADRIVAAEAKIYEYADPNFPDGMRREFVTVQALDSLAQSLIGKPVTDEHPAAGKVTADTWRDLARGVVQLAWVEHPCDENDLQYPACIVSAVISDKALVDKVLKQNVREVSPGYDATLAPAPEGAEFGGAHFLQTARAGNHLAVVLRGRGGSTSSIRLDSAGHAITDEENMEKEELQKKLDEAEAARADMQKKLDAAQAKVDAYEAANKAKEGEDKKADEDKKDERNDAAFVAQYNDRRKAEQTAERFGVAFNAAAPTVDIKKAVVLAKLGADFRVDSAERIDVAFEVASALGGSTPSSFGDAYRRADAMPSTKTTVDEDLFAAYDKKRG